MGARLADLDAYWSPGLTLTVKGREYTLPLPSAELGLWCRRLAEVTGEVHNASSEQEIQAAVARIEALPQLPGDLSLPERVLGDVYQQMAADQVPDPYIQFCGQTGYIWIIGGEDTAERYWTSGGRPEAQRPTNRQARRAQNRAQTGGNRTAGDEKTPPPASTSGTTSPPTPAHRNRGRRKAR
ncbi:DUF7426 family protein [Salinispora cortesiana]|uniref:DUF7426 family protein n=1 Tax=Salinispora cortesiana TaxID=1305843 RepID=UPI00040FC442|nr:hypothetical protein [Salinispora cortesiana]